MRLLLVGVGVVVMRYVPHRLDVNRQCPHRHEKGCE